MRRKTPNYIDELIQTFYQQDLSVAEIARRTQVPYSTVWSYTTSKKKGFASRTEYEGHLAEQRQQKLVNQELSKLIETRLAEIGRTQRWLSVQLGITEGAVSRYASGRTTPRKNLKHLVCHIKLYMTCMV